MPRYSKRMTISSSPGMIDDTNLVPTVQNLSSPSSSGYYYYVMDRVISDVDLLTLILIRLPVKTLLSVCKSVSKQWLSIISNPIFASDHFRRLNPKATGFFFQSVPRKSDYLYHFLLLDGSKFTLDYEGIPLKFGDDPEPGRYDRLEEHPIEISQSCNGLLCCNKETTFYVGDRFVKVFSTYKTYIYNPTTRQHRCLPPSPFRDNVPKRKDCCIKVCGISLAFDPIKSMDHHYQVVCIWTIVPFYHDYWDKDVQKKYYLEIYSSKTNSWRKLNSPSTNPIYAKAGSFSSSGVYWNGCLHWIRTRRYEHSESSMYFDIGQELVKPLPASPNGNESNVVGFGECGGHLCLIELLYSCYYRYDILKMEKDYSGWKHIHKLDLESLITMYPSNESAFNEYIWKLTLCLQEDEAKASSKLDVVVHGKEVKSYNFKKMRATEISSHIGNFFFFLSSDKIAWGYVYQYIESLACV